MIGELFSLWQIDQFNRVFYAVQKLQKEEEEEEDIINAQKRKNEKAGTDGRLGSH